MVSALTASIAKNNNIDPDILWASEAEYQRLDVYYHEAIAALETKLAKQVSPSAKFVYLEEGTDYSLVVDLSPSLTCCSGCHSRMRVQNAFRMA